MGCIPEDYAGRLLAKLLERFRQGLLPDCRMVDELKEQVFCFLDKLAQRQLVQYTEVF